MGLKETATDVLNSAYAKASSEPNSSCDHKEFIHINIFFSQHYSQRLPTRTLIHFAFKNSLNFLGLMMQEQCATR